MASGSKIKKAKTAGSGKASPAKKRKPRRTVVTPRQPGDPF